MTKPPLLTISSGVRARIEDEAGHDVEADPLGAAGVRDQPCRRSTNQPSLLGRINRKLGCALAQGTSGLDLDEGDQPAASNDQVELHAVPANVALEDAITSASQERRGASLALRSELTPHIPGLVSGLRLPVCARRALSSLSCRLCRVHRLLLWISRLAVVRSSQRNVSAGPG